MKPRPTQRSEIEEKYVRDLEMRLNAAMRPIQPRPEFVSELRRRLDQGPSEGFSEWNAWQVGLIAGASLISGVVLIVFGFRVFSALMEAMRQFQDRNKQETEQVIPIQQAA